MWVFAQRAIKRPVNAAIVSHCRTGAVKRPSCCCSTSASQGSDGHVAQVGSCVQAPRHRQVQSPPPTAERSAFGFLSAWGNTRSLGGKGQRASERVFTAINWVLASRAESQLQLEATGAGGGLWGARATDTGFDPWEGPRRCCQGCGSAAAAQPWDSSKTVRPSDSSRQRFRPFTPTASSALATCSSSLPTSPRLLPVSQRGLGHGAGDCSRTRCAGARHLLSHTQLLA